MLHIVWGGEGGGYDSYIDVGVRKSNCILHFWGPLGVWVPYGGGDRSPVRSPARAFARSPVRSPVRSLAHPLARTLVRTYNPPSYNTSGNALKSSLATF